MILKRIKNLWKLSQYSTFDKVENEQLETVLVKDVSTKKEKKKAIIVLPKQDIFEENAEVIE